MTDTKSKDEVKVKKIKGQVSEEEQNEADKLVKALDKARIKY
ncbi:40739_t:CDS:2 [Gigaspora margarita]|uniref:40739_t:CDS:1 n=1 Tax=Gigaspora margarita TaxID=4874 RepID=A0ABN7VD31_GIGMA|nr:40739_t:CDS:2 [Gigaspora margarita]